MSTMKKTYKFSEIYNQKIDGYDISAYAEENNCRRDLINFFKKFGIEKYFTKLKNGKDYFFYQDDIPLIYDIILNGKNKIHKSRKSETREYDDVDIQFVINIMNGIMNMFRNHGFSESELREIFDVMNEKATKMLIDGMSIVDQISDIIKKNIQKNFEIENEYINIYDKALWIKKFKTSLNDFQNSLNDVFDEFICLKKEDALDRGSNDYSEPWEGQIDDYDGDVESLTKGQKFTNYVNYLAENVLKENERYIKLRDKYMHYDKRISYIRELNQKIMSWKNENLEKMIEECGRILNIDTSDEIAKELCYKYLSDHNCEFCEYHKLCDDHEFIRLRLFMSRIHKYFRLNNCFSAKLIIKKRKLCDEIGEIKQSIKLTFLEKAYNELFKDNFIELEDRNALMNEAMKSLNTFKIL